MTGPSRTAVSATNASATGSDPARSHVNIPAPDAAMAANATRSGGRPAWKRARPSAPTSEPKANAAQSAPLALDLELSSPAAHSGNTSISTPQLTLLKTPAVDT